MSDCEDKAGVDMNVSNSRQPIFVVGVPRSGTTLLAAMLAAHSRLSCGTETRFFRFLTDNDPGRLCDPRFWPDKAVNYLFSIKLVGVPVPEHYGVTREQIYAYLKRRPPTVPAILSSLTEQFVRREGKCRWVEKSPEHLMHVDDIRNYFPKSPIIRIVRDPRDAALSMAKTPWGPQDFLEALLLWRKYDERSAAFFLKDENCYTLYYENLIKSPETELRQLCSFMNEGYERQMLDTSRSAGNVVTEKDTWHHIVHRPVDKTRIHVWKRELPEDQNRIAEALIGDRLIAYGYECSERFDRVATVYPSLDALLKHREALPSFVEGGIRFWRAVHNDKHHLMIYLGEPDRDKWLSYKKPERWWDTLRIITQIVKGKLAGRHIYWVRDPAVDAGLGRCSRVLAFVFQLAGESQVA